MRSRLTAVLLVAALAAAPLSSACGARAPIETAPGAGTITTTQLAGKRIADETRRVVAVVRILRNQAEALTQTPANPKNVITKAQMDAVDRAVIVASDKLKASLGVLEQVTSAPNLVNTAKSVVDAIDQLVVALPDVPALKFLIDIVVSTIELTRSLAKGTTAPAMLVEGGRL